MDRARNLLMGHDRAPFLIRDRGMGGPVANDRGRPSQPSAPHRGRLARITDIVERKHKNADRPERLGGRAA
jgi:hypothetical protein